MAVIVYRGLFQGRRLEFLTEVALRLDDTVRVLWLNTAHEPGTPANFFARFMAADPRVTARHELDGRSKSLPRAVRELRKFAGQVNEPVLAIGFSALPYAWALRQRPLIWCIQGIPEERLLHRDSLANRLVVQALWRGPRLGPRPDAIVTVSEGMRRLVNEKTPGVPCVYAPSATIVPTFEPPPRTRRHLLTYLGSGAPWQHLDLLAEVWREIHRLDSRTRFLAVSRDERAGLLGEGLPRCAFERIAVGRPEEVAHSLWQTELGFIVRRPHVVNRVSFPTKFGEFVAAGAPVVVTDIGWDIADIVRETGCGLLVDWEASPEAIARHVIAYRQAHAGSDAVQACRNAAAWVDRAGWIDRLATQLNELLAARPGHRRHPGGRGAGPFRFPRRGIT